jgi:hypothetical protein
MSSLRISCPNCEKEQEVKPLIGKHEITCTACGRLNTAVIFADSTVLRVRLLPNARAPNAAEAPPVRRIPPQDGAARDGTLPLLEKALLECLHGLGACKGNIQIYDKDAGGLTIRSHVGFGADFLALFRVVTVGKDCACGQALQARERIICQNVFLDNRFRSLRRIFLQEGLSAVVSTPLIGPNKKVVGMLSAHFARPHQPSEYALGVMDRSLDRVERILQYLS